jgi:ketosteroid isomerase-like protein
MGSDHFDRAPFDAWNRGDMEGWMSLFDPECEFVSAMEASVEGGHQVYRGHEGLEEFVRESWALWDTFNVSIDHTERRGDTVIAEGTFRARGKESGVELEHEAWWVNKYRSDRIIWSQAFFDREEAIRAAGRGTGAL